MRSLYWIIALLVFAAAGPARADEKKDDGFAPMFNGRDLTGWVNVNCAPSTFYVKDHEIITTGKPTGYLRTEKQYENFIAEFDWMHVPPAPGAVGNSGFFVWADPIPAVGSGYTRGIEVQVLVNLTYRDKKTNAITATSQGDLFSIWGASCVPDRPHPQGWARCLPSENHCKGANEWNHYRVEANNGVLKLAVNGTMVSGVSECKPRKGYLALESEGSECHFRNLKIKELPSTNPKPNEIADVAKGHRSLYTGLDLSGWLAEGDAKKHWHPHDTVLHYDGMSAAGNHGLRSDKEFRDAEFVVDFRFPRIESKSALCELVLRQGKQGDVKLAITEKGQLELATSQGTSSQLMEIKPAGEWNRLHAALKGPLVHVTINGKGPISKGLAGAPQTGALVLLPAAAMDFCNLLVRELNAAPAVEKDIPYADGGDANMLDLYLPRERGFTTIVFTYGGGWHTGGRKAVAPIGQKFQSLGYGCALLSHRLGPKDQFPAQIEDVAAGFAWVKKHIASRGGDSARVFLMGHSSGAHLSLLLAADSKYLAKHKLQLSDIAGVIGLSTPVDLEPRKDGKGFGDALMRGRGADTFGRDPAVLKDASPVQHLSTMMPPFLLVAGERDFPMLEADARAFVDRAYHGCVFARFFLAKGRDHMGVVRALLDEKDPVVEQVVAFVKNPRSLGK